MGAGASYNLGMPLTDELTKEFKSILIAAIDTPYFKVQRNIFDLIYPILTNPNNTYEDIIGTLEVEIRRHENRAISQQIHDVLSRYLELVYSILLSRHERNKNFINLQLDFFKPILEYCKDGPLWVFSLNHDVMIEIICSYFNIPLKCGFNEKLKINNIEFEMLSRSEMKKNKFSFHTKESGINLIKLHGSLDLFVKNDELNYIKVSIDKNDHLKIIEDLKKLDQIEKETSISFGVRCTNEIAYYDEENILQFLRKTIISGKHKYSTKISHTMDDWFFKLFKSYINSVDELYSIGYGFLDPHINQVLIDWLEFSSKRNITIVNPNIKNIPSNFSYLDKQIKIINSGIITFLNPNGSLVEKTKIFITETLRNIFREKFLA
ncbi:SIR2 family protein [Leptospira noumeaensis]|uniref:SIR2 family protein n=1 Tax=Leptospira noumeaensis TaxID=2484964 RepID=UPI00142D7355|nr:SIR2 family protein [Leptospira noumeaensis]